MIEIEGSYIYIYIGELIYFLKKKIEDFFIIINIFLMLNLLDNRENLRRKK